MNEKIFKPSPIARKRKFIRNYLTSKGLEAWGYLDANISLPNQYMMCAMFPEKVVFFRWKNIKVQYYIEMKYEDINEEVLDCCLKRYLFEVKHRNKQKALDSIQGDFQ